MAETLIEFHTPVPAANGTEFMARACGAEQTGGTWQGWIEFVPREGGEPVRSPRETTQPNREDTLYWATGLTPVYLEGALSRALHPVHIVSTPPPRPPSFDGPEPLRSARGVARVEPTESVLDPFSVYDKGEGLLRGQLAALSAWHLVNIAIDYELTREDRTMLGRMPAAALIELIVDAVSRRAERVRGRR